MIVQGDIARLFRADLDAGRLFWAVAPRTHPRLLGTEAGSARASHSGKSYWHIKIGGVPFKRSHLIFCLVHGHFPSPCCDHIDGDSLNDRPGNLREATPTQNAWNHKRRARRIALPMGVRVTGSGRFQARITQNGQQIHLGVYDTPEEARALYLAKRRELFREFA